MYFLIDISSMEGVRDDEINKMLDIIQIPSTLVENDYQNGYNNDDDIFFYEDDKDFMTVTDIEDSSTAANNQNSNNNYVPLKNIIQIVKDVEYTQRTIEDRVSNPHGEHAEDVWIMKKNILKKLCQTKKLFICDTSTTNSKSVSDTTSNDDTELHIVLNLGSSH